MIKKQNLLICPVCQEKGRYIILGELINGGLKIMQQRFDKRAVVIIAKEFAVMCNECGETIFKKEGRTYEDNFVDRSIGVHRVISEGLLGNGI